MQKGQRIEARRLAAQVKAALDSGQPAANFVVRCYQQERQTVEGIVRHELERVLEPDQLARVRVIVLEFQTLMPEPDVYIRMKARS